MSAPRKVFRFGENVNTDDIIAGKYKHRTIDLDELALHVMENIRPGFHDEVERGDLIVAGANFGCGSSREQAPHILAHIGIAAVLAPSFARIFFRNSINIGLLLLTCDTEGIEEGDRLRLLPDEHAIELEDGTRRPVDPIAPEVRVIVEAGGLLPYVRQRGALA